MCETFQMFQMWCQAPDGLTALARCKRGWYSNLNILCKYLVDPRHLWAVLQPRGKLVNCAGLTASQHLDVAIRKIDRITGNFE